MVDITQVQVKQPELLSMILIILATSSDGARDLARVSATCKMLKIKAREFPVLRVVNFQKLTFTAYDYIMHHHTKDLLCMCARAGNQAAQSILGKALLINDRWFWGMIYGDNLQAYHADIDIASSQALHHHKLVRTFILNATSQDIVAMRHRIVNYVIAHAGHNVADENCIFYAIYDMCNYELERHRATRIGCNRVALASGSFETVLVRWEPPHEPSYRDTVISLFDELFPTARD